jgi:hypothetical protein
MQFLYAGEMHANGMRILRLAIINQAVVALVIRILRDVVAIRLQYVRRHGHRSDDLMALTT